MNIVSCKTFWRLGIQSEILSYAEILHKNETASGNGRNSKKLTKVWRKSVIWVEVDKLVCAELEFEIWLIASGTHSSSNITQTFLCDQVLPFQKFQRISSFWQCEMVTWWHVDIVIGDMVTCWYCDWWHGDMVIWWYGDMVTWWYCDIVILWNCEMVTW